MNKPLVFVTVGTDHHRFDRLMEWVENWPALRRGSVRCVVQHGPARAPLGAECHPFLEHPQMRALFSDADLVLCQGGPGSIMEAREAGRLPIVVPRVPELDEVVDDHQVRFSRHIAELGKIALAESQEALHERLDEGLSDTESFRVPPDAHSVGPVIDRFGMLVDGIVAAPRRGFRRRR